MLKNFDLLGREPKLFLNKSSKFYTSLGGVVSIMAVILIGLFVVYFFIELLSRKRANIMYNKLEDPASSVNMTEFPFIIRITPGNFQPYQNRDRLFKLFASNGSPLQVENCDINKHFGNYSSYFKDITYLSDSYCLPYKKYDLTLTGVPGSNGHKYVNIDVKRCINGITVDPYGQVQNSSNCVDYDTWYNTMLSSYIYYWYLDYSIDHNDNDNPSKLVLKSASYQISSTIFKRYFVSIKNVNYTTDVGYAFEENRMISFSQQDKVDETMDLRKDVNGKFGQFTIVMSSTVDVYYRSYVKLQTTIANIGGILKSTLFLANLLVYYINDKRYYAYIHSLVYCNEQVEEVSMRANTKQLFLDSHKPITKLPVKIVKENKVQNTPIILNIKDMVCPIFCLNKKSIIMICKERFETILSIDYILKKLNTLNDVPKKIGPSDNFELHEDPKILNNNIMEKNNFLQHT